jgi:uncharacterized membrane protein YoaK (UPF0700 family)
MHNDGILAAAVELLLYGYGLWLVFLAGVVVGGLVVWWIGTTWVWVAEAPVLNKLNLEDACEQDSKQPSA